MPLSRLLQGLTDSLQEVGVTGRLLDVMETIPKVVGPSGKRQETYGSYGGRYRHNAQPCHNRDTDSVFYIAGVPHGSVGDRSSQVASG